IPVVVKKMAWSWLIVARDAVVTPVDIIGAQDIQGFVIVDEARNEEIQFAVVVIIEPHGVRGPTRRGHTSFVCNIRESAIRVVVIKNIAAITCDVEINPAVPVIIRGADTHAKSVPRDTRLLSDITKSAIMIIPVQCIA